MAVCTNDVVGLAKRDRLLEHFVAGTTARAAAELVGVHRNTSFYTRLRKVIAEEMEKASPVSGEIEVDESDASAGPHQRNHMWRYKASTTVAVAPAPPHLAIDGLDIAGERIGIAER